MENPSAVPPLTETTPAEKPPKEEAKELLDQLSKKHFPCDSKETYQDASGQKGSVSELFALCRIKLKIALVSNEQAIKRAILFVKSELEKVNL
ncbi:hypothetical protein KJ632_03810 [Patescibacteria group bacterium]|nr:hypothetical protein [Patescibacteria group bacterium]